MIALYTLACISLSQTTNGIPNKPFCAMLLREFPQGFGDDERLYIEVNSRTSVKPILCNVVEGFLPA